MRRIMKVSKLVVWLIFSHLPTIGEVQRNDLTANRVTCNNPWVFIMNMTFSITGMQTLSMASVTTNARLVNVF